jgi:DNA-binding transcriptional regulator YiaG
MQKKYTVTFIFAKEVRTLLDGQEIASIRTRLRWSQEKAAHNLRYSLRHYQRFESGEARMPYDAEKKFLQLAN